MNFRKLLSIGTVTMLITGSLAGCGVSKTNTTNTKLSTKADIVVIGAGGAGLCSAVEAKNAGANVIVLEKMPIVGGNTLRATGGINAAETKFQKNNNIKDSVEKFYEDTMKGGYYKNDPQLVKVLTSEATSAVEWLSDLGVDLTEVGRLAGATNDRAHRPAGGKGVGSNIVKAFKKVAQDKKIDIRLNNKAVEILQDNKGSITGVKALNEESKEYIIDAKSVIIATGGFAANAEKIVKYNPSLKGFMSTNHRGATGDGIDMAAKIGAELIQMNEIQTHPTVVPKTPIMITEAVRGNGAILVNRDGNRFINELATRDVVSKAILDQKGNTAYLLFDDNVRNSLKFIDNYINMKIVVQGDSVEDLAKKINVNADSLKKTVSDYNEFVKNKKDDEFNRENMPRSFRADKYYAIEVAPAVHYTMGGIKINKNAEVLDKSDEVIKGLYAAGEVTGGVQGGNRLGGNSLADIIVFGRIAGKNAADFVK